MKMAGCVVVLISATKKRDKLQNKKVKRSDA
jgi:hypothetical protein